MMSVYMLGINVLSFKFVFVMLPSYFMDGWFIAQFLRTLLTGERWPRKIPSEPTQEQISFLLWRARGILAAILCFVLIMVIQGGALVFLTDIQTSILSRPQATPPEGSLMMLFLGVVLMLFSIWSFRLLWLYIPLIILTPLGGFLKEIRGFMTSVYMIGVWVMSVVPIMFFVLFIAGFFIGADSNLSKNSSGELKELTVWSPMDSPSIIGFLAVLWRVIGEVVSTVIVATAMAYAMKDILIKYGAKPIFKEPNRQL